MREKRITETLSHGRISYPQFDADGHGIICERINAFYRALRDAAAAYAEESGGASRIYTADYSLRRDGDTITVEYILRIRHRGRIEAQKTLIHTWKNGYLIPPEKKKRRREEQKRKTRLKPAAKNDII